MRSRNIIESRLLLIQCSDLFWGQSRLLRIGCGGKREGERVVTITIKRSTAMAVIVLIGVLGGLALGQVADAVSSGGRATASYITPVEKNIRKISGSLEAIKAALGEKGYIDPDILGYLKEIRGNTYGACQNTGGSPFCHN